MNWQKYVTWKNFLVLMLIPPIIWVMEDGYTGNPLERLFIRIQQVLRFLLLIVILASHFPVRKLPNLQESFLTPSMWYGKKLKFNLTGTRSIIKNAEMI